MHLGLVGHQFGEACGQNGSPRTRGRPARHLVEDQVDDGEHGGEPVRSRWAGGTRNGIPAALIFASRARPLGHRLLGNEEGAGDLFCSEPAERSQRERHQAVERERWVATQRTRLQPLVGIVSSCTSILRRGSVRRAAWSSPRACGRGGCDRSRVSPGRHQPRAGILRRPVARPALGGGSEGLLRGLLGEVEIAEEADQAGEDAAPLVAEDLLEDGQRSTSGRTSTAPPMRAAGTRGELDRGVEVVGLEKEVAAERLFDGDERPVRGQRLAVLHTDGGLVSAAASGRQADARLWLIAW